MKISNAQKIRNILLNDTTITAEEFHVFVALLDLVYHK